MRAFLSSSTSPLLMGQLWNISFLNDALRICQMDYEPTTGAPFTLFGFRLPFNGPPAEDILRTRLTTLGVEEHRLILEGGQIEQKNQEWLIYDVGGSRTQRGKYARVCVRLSMPTPFQ